MNHLIIECNELLKNQGFKYAICGDLLFDFDITVPLLSDERKCWLIIRR